MGKRPMLPQDCDCVQCQVRDKYVNTNSWIVIGEYYAMENDKPQLILKINYTTKSLSALNMLTVWNNNGR